MALGLPRSGWGCRGSSNYPPEVDWTGTPILLRGIDHGTSPTLVVSCVRTAGRYAVAMGVNCGARVLDGRFQIGVRKVVDWFQYRFGGAGRVISEALVQGFFGPECRSVEAVGADPVAEPHGRGHIRGFGLGQDVQRGHAEGYDVGGLQHFGAGAGAVAVERFNDLIAGVAHVLRCGGDVGQEESDDAFEEGAGV
jgi:hypothetical protein